MWMPFSQLVIRGMIGRVRAVYNPAYAGFDGEGKAIEGPASLRGLVKEGYVELVGVINPRSVGEIHYVPLPPTPKPKPEKDTQKAETEQETDPILYEYFWSAGMTGFDPKWYERLDDDDPIVVQLIFHTKDSKYATQEVAANLKQVPPFQKTTEKKIRDWFEQFQHAEFPWWVKTFSTGEDAGIEWHVPRRLVQYVGNRLVGSLGIYFIECDTSNPTLKDEISMEMRAFLRSPRREELYISPTNIRTELTLRPNAPKPKP